MKHMIAITLISVFISAHLASSVAIQQKSDNLAIVEVVAYDTRGIRLGAPNVSVFESEDHANLAARFSKGAAENIPFGVYRVEARLPGYFSELRYVRVYQHRVVIVLGLNLGNELPVVPPSLHGRVLGINSANSQEVFAKLMSVFSNVSLESKINPSGEFQMAGATDGLYVLLIVGPKGVMASRTISIPYPGSLIVDVARNEQ